MPEIVGIVFIVLALVMIGIGLLCIFGSDEIKLTLEEIEQFFRSSYHL